MAICLFANIHTFRLPVWQISSTPPTVRFFTRASASARHALRTPTICSPSSRLWPLVSPQRTTQTSTPALAYSPRGHSRASTLLDLLSRSGTKRPLALLSVSRSSRLRAGETTSLMSLLREHEHLQVRGSVQQCATNDWWKYCNECMMEYRQILKCTAGSKGVWGSNRT